AHPHLHPDLGPGRLDGATRGPAHGRRPGLVGRTAGARGPALPGPSRGGAGLAGPAGRRVGGRRPRRRPRDRAADLSRLPSLEPLSPNRVMGAVRRALLATEVGSWVTPGDTATP